MLLHGAMTQTPNNLIILGSGPAGLTACIYAARANLEPLCIEGFSAGGLVPGGQLMFTTEIENYPGFPDKIRGPDLMQRFRDQAERQGARFVTADATRLDLSSPPFKVWADEDEPYVARTLIVATGARANYIGLESEERLKNKGVSACAVCDGALYRGQDVAVVGGGDTAMEEASYLAGLCKSVTLVHRRGELRASKTMQQRVLSNPKIQPVLEHVVDEVLDVQRDEVTGVRLRHVRTGEIRNVPVRALFVAIGHTPNTELVRGQLELHDNGYVRTKPGTTQTSVRGVFAAGDVQDWVYRQAVTAAGTGCMAALEVERFLGASSHPAAATAS
jgi:thioredoxin reductase (NADPH)